MIDSLRILEAMNSLRDICGPGRPVCLCITDENGFVLGFVQTGPMDSRAFTMARAKARTAALMKQKTSEFHARLARDSLTVADFGDGPLTSVTGGVPVKNRTGEVLGGVAVAGRFPEEDEHSALEIAALLAENQDAPEGALP